MVNFRIVENYDYYEKYGEWLDLYNNHLELSSNDIRIRLELSWNKIKKFKEYALENGELKVDARKRGVKRRRI